MVDGSWATLRATVDARLPRQRWPQRTVLIAAVNAHMGNRWRSTARAESRRLLAGAGALPFGGRTPHPLNWGIHLAAQLEELRAGGDRVETIIPDSNPGEMFGANAMDLSMRPAAT